MFAPAYFARAYFAGAYFAGGTITVIVVPPVEPPVVIPPLPRVVTLAPTTIRDLVTSALQELNIIDAATAIDADNAKYALDRLNDYVDALATEGLTVHHVSRVTWPITTAASYTIGGGGAINVVRPVSPQAIEAIGYLDTSVGPPYYERQVSLLTVGEYAAIPFKTETSPWPRAFYYNPTYGVAEWGTMTPFPIPTSTTLLGVIYVPSSVGTFTSLNDFVSLPPGYRRMLRLALAIEIAGAFGAKLPPTLEQRAAEAKANVKRTNIRIEEMQTCYAGHYDIWTDES